MGGIMKAVICILCTAAMWFAYTQGVFENRYILYGAVIVLCGIAWYLWEH